MPQTKHPITAYDLMCNGRRNPLGIDDETPCLSWRLAGGGQGAQVCAWQVRVGSEPEGADVWEQGGDNDDQSLSYAGPALTERCRYWWQVRIQDDTGTWGPWSAPGWFESAFFTANDFPGAWLSADPISADERHPLAGAQWIRHHAPMSAPLCAFMTEFALPDAWEPVEASLHIYAQSCAHPWSEWQVQHHVRVNGEILSASHYLKARGPLCFDMAHLLTTGANRVAVFAWQGDDSAFCARLILRGRDGSLIELGSDDSWRWHGMERADVAGDWDGPDNDWQGVETVGAFGAGPWPDSDPRNRADRLLPALVLQRSLQIDRPLRQARLYASALGCYELQIDGVKLGDRILAPGWTDYHTRLHYQCEDATALLPPGAHVLQATIADGWYAGHLAVPFGCGFYGHDKALKLALYLDYADGTQEVICTDPEHWLAGCGPVRRGDLMEGQITDLRCVAGAWRRPRCSVAPAGRLQAQPDEPVRILQRLPAQRIDLRAADRVVVDFGQNLVGVVELRLRAPAGTRIRVRHAEVLDLEGEVWTENLRTALATDVHIASGGEDVFAPAFTFHGFRYAEISGLPEGLASADVCALVYGSDTEQTGRFLCDNPLLNRLQENIRWSQRGNFLSIPTDCPQRDERMGWTGDTQVFVRTAVFNADCWAFYRKYVEDMLDAQSPGGAFPHYAPTDKAIESGAFAWACAGVMIPWWLWRIYGDTTILRRAWTGIRRYLDQRDAQAIDDLNRDWSFGDWLSPPPKTPYEVLSPLYHAWCHRLAYEMAVAIDATADSEHFQERFARIRQAWRRAYLDDDCRCSTDSQTAYACALQAGVMAAEEVQPHLQRCLERSRWHVNAGFIGSSCLLPALSAAGLDDLAWQVLLQEDLPGWLYTVRNGATTMWERWDSYDPIRGPANVGGMNSYNHYAFGAVGEWIYAHILGMDRAPEDVGCRELVLAPKPAGHCRHAAGSWRAPRGVISSCWTMHDDGRFDWQFSLPPGCRAEIVLPHAPRELLVEGCSHLPTCWRAAGAGRYVIGSGTWAVQSRA